MKGNFTINCPNLGRDADIRQDMNRRETFLIEEYD